MPLPDGKASTRLVHDSIADEVPPYALRARFANMSSTLMVCLSPRNRRGRDNNVMLNVVAYMYIGWSVRTALAIGLNRQPPQRSREDLTYSKAAWKTWWLVLHLQKWISEELTCV